MYLGVPDHIHGLLGDSCTGRIVNVCPSLFCGEHLGGVLVELRGIGGDGQGGLRGLGGGHHVLGHGTQNSNPVVFQHAVSDADIGSLNLAGVDVGLVFHQWLR